MNEITIKKGPTYIVQPPANPRPSERSEIARNAVRARWAKAGKLKPDKPVIDPPASPQIESDKPQPDNVLPFSMFRGNLQIGDMNMECHVLNDFRRVFTQRSPGKYLKIVVELRLKLCRAKFRLIELSPLLPKPFHCFLIVVRTHDILAGFSASAASHPHIAHKAVGTLELPRPLV